MKSNALIWLLFMFLLFYVLSVQSMHWFSKHRANEHEQESVHVHENNIESIPDLQDIEIPITSETTFEKINRAIRKVTSSDMNTEKVRKEEEEEEEEEAEAQEEYADNSEGGTWKDSLKESAESLKEKGSKVIQNAKEKANEWTDKVKEKVKGTSDTLKEKGGELKDKLKEKGEQVVEKGTKLKDDVKYRADSYFSPSSFMHGPKEDDEDDTSYWKRSANARSLSLNEWYDRLLTEIQKVFTSHPSLSDLNDPYSALSLGAGLEWRQTDAEYTLGVDLAGIPQDRVHVTLVSPDLLEIHAAEPTVAKKKASTKGSPFTDSHVDGMLLGIHRQLDRSIRLPSDIQAEHISAYYKDGLLLIKFPKSVAKPKNIKIQSFS